MPRTHTRLELARRWAPVLGDPVREALTTR
jgi:hypothetical protein